MAALPSLRDLGVRTSQLRAQVADSARPSLELVQRQRRWPAMLAGAAWAIVFVGLLGTAVFHTQLAERQLQIDRLDRELFVERERFDDLRYARAELRSPVRLAEAATELGMSRGRLTTFVAVDPSALARQLAAAGPSTDDVVQFVVATDPLAQFRAVKNVSGGQR
jgi:hypothetical protein